MCTKSKPSWLTATFRSPCLVIDSDDASISDRQDRLDGFDTTALRRSTVVVVGCGGLGSHLATSLVRKGVGEIRLVDADQVDHTNLCRQHFYRSDLRREKAFCLAKNAAREGVMGSRLIGHYTRFSETTADVLSEGVDLAIVGVDNDRTRVIASRYFPSRGIPAIFTAVNEAANYTWCFVQEQASPCVACLYPAMAAALTKAETCATVASSIDILKASSALVSYAVNSILMDCQRDWNFLDIDLTGSAPNVADNPKPRPGCPVCGAPSSR